MVSCPKENFTNMRTGGLTKWLLVACLLVMAARSGETAGTRVVCYYTNWSVYRPGTAKFNPQNINPYLCTHLIYAFGGFTKENTLKPFDKYQDIEKGGYAKFTGLKTYNQNLKTMIAIGGWNEGSSRFSSLVASAERRRELVKNSIKFMRQNKFDGLDLDWEYPAFRDGGKPKDRGNYAKLVQELRQEFDKESAATGRPRLLLTMAVPAGIEYIDKGYDVPKLNRYLDWMNILSYDYHSAFEPAVDHHSPLYALEAASEYNYDSELNIDYTIKHYLEAGAERDKLVLGIPTYGRSFTLFNPESTDIGAPADGPGEQGDATREKGYLAYYEICESLMPKTRSKRQSDDDDEEEYEDEEEAEEWTVVQPNPKAMGPFAYKGNQWVGYDDIDIVKKKAEYVAEQGLGGIMFWSIDNDDFRGKCHGKPYPLIEAAKGALYKSLGLTEKIPPKKTQSTRKRPRPSKPSKSSDEDKDVSKNTIRNNRKKNRVTEAEPEDEPTTKSPSRQRPERRRSSTRAPATAAATPDWGLNTPEPPTTPDPGTDFKCEEEGFFPHPRDCKKYFWCLESGPSNLGIIAHQFTCPSGLYFNKAADSCDFSRNVVCNPKKAETTAAPRTTTTTTTEAPDTTTSSRPPSSLAALFVTRRPLPRITAATSKTTLLVRGTTTPVPVEEEYEDTDEEKIEGLPELDSEEDPKVIKELVDLIKKLGGIEQLEKHLANTGKGSQGTKTTTPATISRLLFERVLSQARPNGERAPPQINSRGPQAAGLTGTVVDTETKSNTRSRRPQYTTINRNRPSTTTEEAVEESDEDISAEDDEEEKEYKRPSSTTTRSGLPQYVNIRRARPSTTEEPQPTIRNALYERDSLESTSDEDDVKNGVQGFEYSTIRRFRPESQESQETTTSKYKVIQRVRPTTVASSSEDKDDLEKTTLSIREISTEIPSTSSPSTQSSVMTSPKYATVSRFPNTTPSGAVETTIYNQNDITEANDINVEIASPSFASENGFVKNIDSSSVLNAQITTLSNIPKFKDERTNSLGSNPISYSTEVTVSEEPFSSTQKITLFAKRTRPTTTSTANPPDISETTTSANKVSFDRKYASVKRTRLFASSNTSSPLLRARLNNDIVSDTDEDTVDEDTSSDSILAERNETLLQDRFRPRIRKIRSTTPASDENKNDNENTDSEEANYGSKKFVRPQSRFSARRFQSISTSQGEKVDESEVSGVPKIENGLPSIRKFIPKGTPLNGLSTFRTRKLQTSSTQAAEDSDSASNGSEIDSQSEIIESSSRRPQPRRQFRPSLSSFESADLSSLTALDNTRRREENADTSTGFRNSQVNRRFRPSFTSNTKEPLEDSQNSDSSITPVISERQRSYVTRGGRFTTIRTTVSNSEQDAEILKSSVVPRARKLGIARFSPRPFTRVTESDAEDEEEDLRNSENSDLSEDNELNAEISYESKPIGAARLTAPVINVIEENKTRGSSFSSPSGSINVTKIINSNILLGQTNNKSGILLLRRPSLLSSGSLKSSEDVRNITKIVDEKLERIHLSESNIEEKGLVRETALLLERPRKRIIVKKLRSTISLSDTPTTEESPFEFNKGINVENIGEPVGSENGKNETGRLRIRKVLRRRPATSTTAEEQTTTERIHNELLENDKFDLNKTNLVQDAPLPRIRKIIRKKLKPILTDGGKISILQTKNQEEANPNIESTTEKIENTSERIENTSERIENTSERIESTSERIENTSEKIENTSEKIENTSEKIENTSTEESVTRNENIITTNVAEEVDLQTDQTTLPTSTTRFRPSYRPPKRPLNLSTTTEASTTPKVYSRRYNNGPYTTPILPSERESGITERPRIEGLTRRPTFSVRPFGRRPFITTSRTTTTVLDEQEYSDEDTPNEDIEEKEEKLVFVPLDKLFTRAPVLSSNVDEPSLNEENKDDKNSESEEYDNEDEEEENDIITSTAKPINRFALSQRTSVPSRVGLLPGRQSNRPLGFNRQVETNQTNEEGSSRRFNRPVAFQPNRSNRFGFSSTQSPESTSKGYVRKYTANKPTSETAQAEIDVDAINAKHKQLFSNPKRFTTTTITSPSQETATESEDFTTEMYQEVTTDINETTESETDSNEDIWLSMTENSANDEITTMNDLIIPETTVVVTDAPTNDQTTISDSMTVQTDASIIKESEENITTSTIKPHHIFSVNNSEKVTTDKHSKDNTILDVSTDSPYIESSTELIYENGSVKTSSHLDRLFAVSRIVEVSSKQDKHRLNSKNESRLIEVGEIIQEKKPMLDRIGEVSRFTLIKIVEGDIPKYLTNLSHEYPGEESPPFNPIRIDEARNARTLNIFSDNPKESLVASESVNAAYNHKNGFVEYIESIESENQDNKINDKNVFIVESTTLDEDMTTPEASTPVPTTPSTTTYAFVPGAVDLDELKNSNVNDVPKKSNNPIESSTLALEGLFKSDDMVTGRQARIDLVPGPQPFVVYAAPQSSITKSKSDALDSSDDSRSASGRSITNFVKIQILDSEKEKNISTPVKPEEFLGVPAAVDVILEKENAVTKSPITITVLNQTSTKESTGQNATPESIVISIASLDKVLLEKTENVSNIPTTTAAATTPATLPAATPIEPSPSTPQVEVAHTTTGIIDLLNVTELFNETTTVFPILSNTSLLNTQSESDTDSTLSKIAKKRPKLPYIRRYQNNQIKSSNATRISVAPSVSQNAKKSTKSSSDGKNVPFTTPKYNRTNSYTSGKSRFSAIRTQNVPVDSRRQKPETNKFKPSSATDSSRTTLSGSDPSNKVTIKPFRTNALRASLFARRTTTEATTQDIIETTLQTVTDVPSSDNTIAPGLENFRGENSKTETGARPSLFARRPANRLNSKLEQSRRGFGTTTTTTEPSSATPGSRFSALGNLRRRPTFERRKTNPSPADGGSATEAAEAETPRARPTRLFVRKYQRSGTSNQTTPRTTSTTGSSGSVTTTRRSFRVGVRKRPLIISSTSTTTILLPTVNSTSNSDEDVTTTQYTQLETGGHDQETHSTVQQIEEKESSVEILQKKRVKIQKRPLFSTFKDNQNIPKEFKAPEENATKDEELNQTVGRKYSSVIKQDNTLVQREKDISELINAELSIDDIGDGVTASVAVAAHQLLSAPLPTIPSYALDDQSDTGFSEEVPLTRAYLLASPSSPFVSPNNYVATTERYQGRSKLGFLNKSRRISTTVVPQVVYTTSRTTPVIRRRKPSSPPAAFEKINPVKKIYRTVVDYEYYDDDDVRLVGKTPLQEKVVLRGSGVIQCLDQGNFPHPESCKKFISCAKIENGGVYGWAYTCPKGLSFDPVGGICNWSAGLGCQE